MSATIRWSAFANTTADSYNVYRAITGFIIPYPNSLVINDVLIFSATSQTRQSVTFTALTLNGIVAAINAQAKGLVATSTQAGDGVIVRCTAKSDPKLRLYPCTALQHLSIPPTLIGPHNNFTLLANVAQNPLVTDYSYVDTDGTALDYYHLTTVTSGVESLPTQNMLPVITPEAVCIVEGRIIDGQNNPLVGAVISAQIQVPVGMSDNSGINRLPITTITDELGRWSLPFLQGQLVLFQISDVGYNEVVAVPATPFVLFKDLQPVDDYVFGDTNS